jgi:hypothetical protein
MGGGKQRPHEGALITKYAAALVADAVGFHEIGVGAETAPVPLIGGEAVEAEQGQCSITGALRRQEVPVVGAAVRLDELHPAPGEAFEVSVTLAAWRGEAIAPAIAPHRKPAMVSSSRVAAMPASIGSAVGPADLQLSTPLLPVAPLYQTGAPLFYQP